MLPLVTALHSFRGTKTHWPMVHLDLRDGKTVGISPASLWYWEADVLDRHAGTVTADRALAIPQPLKQWSEGSTLRFGFEEVDGEVELRFAGHYICITDGGISDLDSANRLHVIEFAVPVAEMPAAKPVPASVGGDVVAGDFGDPEVIPGLPPLPVGYYLLAPDDIVLAPDQWNIRRVRGSSSAPLLVPWEQAPAIAVGKPAASTPGFFIRRSLIPPPEALAA